MSMFRIGNAGWAVAVLLTGAAVRAQSVQVVKPLKNFRGQTGTYSWRPSHGTSERVLAGWVHAFVDKDLQAKGWQLVATGGDFTVDVSDVDKTILTDTGSGYSGFGSFDERRPSATWGSQRGYLASQASGLGASEAVETARYRIFTFQIYDGRGKKKLFKAQVLDSSRDRDSVLTDANRTVDAVLAPLPAVHRVNVP